MPPTLQPNGSRPIGGQDRPAILLASGIGEAGGIFVIGNEGPQRLSGVATTGMVSWNAGTRIATIQWSGEDPAPATSRLTRRRGSHSEGCVGVPVSEPHGLLWHRGSLHAVSTAANSILSLDAHGDVRSVWKAPGDGDCWHLNSLGSWRGRLFASAFGRFAHHRAWAEGDRRYGAGVVFEPVTGREILRGLSCPHDPAFIDGTWVVCNSAEKAVVRFASDGSELARVELGGWTRGLAHDRCSLYVGVSAHRMIEGQGRARVVRLDRKHLEPVGEWRLPCPEVFALSWVTPEVVAGYAAGSGQPELSGGRTAPAA